MHFSCAQFIQEGAVTLLSYCMTLCDHIRDFGTATFPKISYTSANLSSMLLLIDYSNFVVHIILFISQQVLLVIIKPICY